MSATVTEARATTAPAAAHEYVTFRLAEQWLGLDVMAVQEVLIAMQIDRVPLAPTALAGFLNLRGQIVTAVDLRTTLRMPPRTDGAEIMNVVVRHGGELFAFMVDEVGDVVSVDADAVAPPPPTLDVRWRAACQGIVRRDVGLLLVLNVDDLLRLEHPAG